MYTVKKSTIIIVMTLVGVALMNVGSTAHAFPAYSQKEKKPCVFCHVNAKGGGKRNATGNWYKKHGLSFAGYTLAKANAEAGGGAPQPKATPKPKAKPTPKPPAKKKA